MKKCDSISVSVIEMKKIFQVFGVKNLRVCEVGSLLDEYEKKNVEKISVVFYFVVVGIYYIRMLQYVEKV